MRNLNFSTEFAADIVSGKKRQTIRKRGKLLPPAVGDDLMLFTGLRTAQSRRLLAVKVTSVESVAIVCSSRYVAIARPVGRFGDWAFMQLSDEEVEQLAGYLLKWD